MSTDHLLQHRWRLFLLGWVVVNLLGGALGGVLEARFEFLGTLVLEGGAVGLGQWLLLRRRLLLAAHWAWALTLGWPLSNLLWISAGNFYDPLVEALTNRGLFWEVFWLNALRMAAILPMIAIWQGLLLRRRRLALPSWFLSNIAGGIVLGALKATVCLYFCDVLATRTMTGVVLGASSWAGYALVTGPVLVYLLRHQSTAWVRPIFGGSVEHQSLDCQRNPGNGVRTPTA